MLSARLAALAYRIMAAPEHAGIMVALVPTAEDAARLALDGDPAELHVTLCHWGDASAMPLDVREAFVGVLRDKAALYTPLLGKTFGVGVFNPTTDEPALVLNVGGDAIAAFYDEIEGLVSGDQHAPWAAHMTLAQPAAVALLSDADIAARMGPVTFDRVRIAFGDATIDLPFAVDQVKAAEASRIVYQSSTLSVSRGAASTAIVDGDQITFPVVAFVEGIRQPANSAGPELFLASQFEQALESAVGMPVVFQHPKKGDRYVSAKDGPFNPQTGVPVGVVSSARFDDAGRMIVQVVALMSKIRAAGPDAAAMGDAIARGEQVDVSIGHYSSVVSGDGTWGGAPYSGVHTNILFDHLALLSLGQDGACAIHDGCGTNRR